jgi:protein SCO1
MTSKWILWLLVLSLLPLAACASTAVSDSSTLAPTAFPTPNADGITELAELPITDFDLLDQGGTQRSLHDLEGGLVLMTFGYTHCPDVCPVTLARFRQVKDLLPADLAMPVQFVFVSVDGLRDTPERLQDYLGNFEPSFIGLTTSDESVARDIIHQFNGEFRIKNAEGLRENYSVDHTASAFLLDPSGRWIRTFEYNTNPNTIAQVIINWVGGQAGV